MTVAATGSPDGGSQARARVPSGSPAAPCVWLLGGIDPSGGSGLLRDAWALTEVTPEGVTIAIAPIATCLTVQGDGAPARAFEVRAEWLAAALAGAAVPEVIKIGAVGPVAARAIVDVLAGTRALSIFDPVWRASDGGALGADLNATVELARACSLVTPNLAEAQAMLGAIGDDTGHDARGGGARGADASAGETRGGGARSGEARGGEARGGEARGGEARGGEARDGAACGGEARDPKAGSADVREADARGADGIVRGEVGDGQDHEHADGAEHAEAVRGGWRDLVELERCALRLADALGTRVLLKGGPLRGGGLVADVLASRGCTRAFVRARVPGPDPRGTGCALASAIAALLAAARWARSGPPDASDRAHGKATVPDGSAAARRPDHDIDWALVVARAIAWLDAARLQTHPGPDGRVHLGRGHARMAR